MVVTSVSLKQTRLKVFQYNKMFMLYVVYSKMRKSEGVLTAT